MEKKEKKVKTLLLFLARRILGPFEGGDCWADRGGTIAEENLTFFGQGQIDNHRILGKPTISIQSTTSEKYSFLKTWLSRRDSEWETSRQPLDWVCARPSSVPHPYPPCRVYLLSHLFLVLCCSSPGHGSLSGVKPLPLACCHVPRGALKWGEVLIRLGFSIQTSLPSPSQYSYRFLK